MSTIIPPGTEAIKVQNGQQNVISDKSFNSTSNTLPQKQNHSVSTQQLRTTLNGINQKLVNTNLKVEFASNQPAGGIWLNVVDTATGNVVQKLPPESARKLSASHSVKGLQIDNQL
jgi:uncharacterized FlaG/YvyC family protein